MSQPLLANKWPPFTNFKFWPIDQLRKKKKIKKLHRRLVIINLLPLKPRYGPQFVISILSYPFSPPLSPSRSLLSSLLVVPHPHHGHSCHRHFVLITIVVVIAITFVIVTLIIVTLILIILILVVITPRCLFLLVILIIVVFKIHLDLSVVSSMIWPVSTRHVSSWEMVELSLSFVRETIGNSVCSMIEAGKFPQSKWPEWQYWVHFKLTFTKLHRRVSHLFFASTLYRQLRGRRSRRSCSM